MIKRNCAWRGGGSEKKKKIGQMEIFGKPG